MNAKMSAFGLSSVLTGDALDRYGARFRPLNIAVTQQGPCETEEV